MSFEIVTFDRIVHDKISFDNLYDEIIQKGLDAPDIKAALLFLSLRFIEEVYKLTPPDRLEDHRRRYNQLACAVKQTSAARRFISAVWGTHLRFNLTSRHAVQRIAIQCAVRDGYEPHHMYHGHCLNLESLAAKAVQRAVTQDFTPQQLDQFEKREEMHPRVNALPLPTRLKEEVQFGVL